jgi:hypothetical protein
MSHHRADGFRWPGAEVTRIDATDVMVVLQGQGDNVAGLRGWAA